MSIQENKKLLAVIFSVIVIASASVAVIMLMSIPENGNNTGDTMVTDIYANGDFSLVIYGYYQGDSFYELGRTTQENVATRLSQCITYDMNFTINVDGNIQHSIQVYRGESKTVVYFGISFNIYNDRFA